MSKWDELKEKDEGNTLDLEKSPAMEQLWGERGEFINSYVGLMCIPILLFIIYSYYKWLDHAESRKNKFFIMLSTIPVGIIYFICLLMFLMQNYQP